MHKATLVKKKKRIKDLKIYIYIYIYIYTKHFFTSKTMRGI